MHDGLNGYVLNIGGWGNQTTAFQRIDGNDMPQIPNNISQHVEEGRWYDIRIDVKGGKFTYSLDGKQMLETTIENIQRYVVSGYDEYGRTDRQIRERHRRAVHHVDQPAERNLRGA